MLILQLFMAAAITAVTFEPALACSCARPIKSASTLASDGSIVVKGIAVSEDISSEPAGIVTYRFKVSHSVNAKLRDEITLKSQVSFAACGARLDVGAVSLVWLHGSERGEYWFSSCGQVAVHQDLEGWNAVLDASQ